MGVGLHLPLSWIGLAVRCLRCGRLRPAHRGLAGLPQHADLVRAQCSGAGPTRVPTGSTCFAHHSDRGSQYVSIRSPNARSRRAYGLFGGQVVSTAMTTRWLRSSTCCTRPRVIPRWGPCKTREPMQLATLQCVHGSNHARLLTPIGGSPPAEAKANYWRQHANSSTPSEVST